MGGPFLSLPGLICGKMELGKIERGESSEAGKQFAQIGMWVSVANFAFFFLIMGGLCIFYIFMFAVFGVSTAAQTY
jgi:hypothetical protein